MDEETKAKYREEQTRLITLIEAFVALEKNKDWKVLKELVFDKSLQAIERQMLNESLALDVNVNKIYKLQGEWAWAKQYSDTNRFITLLKGQLSEIKKKLDE